jgi:predicted lipid-binding transport protein (Tim44 family)
MAYENVSAAYNFDLFRDNTAPKLPGDRTTEKKTHKNKTKVVTLPQDEIVRIRRRKHNPFRVFVASVTGALITGIVAVIIIGQVQLTELNQQIITAEETLRNIQSTYTQVQMAVQSKLSTSEIEKYAKDKLGMNKAENVQNEFVSLSEGDKAEISEDANQNFFQKIINAFTGLWS